MDRQIQKRKWPPKKIAWVSVSALFILAIAYNLIFGDHSSKLNVRAERLTVSTVYNGEFQEFIPVTGAVIPIKTNYLDAIEGGRVDTVFLEAGTTVEKGDRILKLGNTNLLLDIMYREAELVQQSNNLRNTRLTMAQRRLAVQGQILELDYQIKQQKRVFEQSSELKQKGLIAGQEYEEASDEYEYLVATRELTMEQYRQDSIYRETQIAQLEGSLARMESNLEVVRQNLDNLVLRAPISGQLTSLNAEVGESKGRGERLGQIDVLEGFKVRVPIDEHYIARVDMGLAGECTYNDSVPS
ncbi:MAG: HlyD family efflux transporter periplasmic adaptor subunit, partial [candidate division Zixibacteria bacterium]|nr:HlyD family efflux transporter periplasmic adaptor subunit [candidate division Zixibacteria bacterium]